MIPKAARALFTQSQISNILGVSIPQVSKMLNRKAATTKDNQRKLINQTSNYKRLVKEQSANISKAIDRYKVENKLPKHQCHVVKSQEALANGTKLKHTLCLVGYDRDLHIADDCIVVSKNVGLSPEVIEVLNELHSSVCLDYQVLSITSVIKTDNNGEFFVEHESIKREEY